jgi:hypothetical protein
MSEQIKKTQLEGLIRQIVRGIVKEIMSSSDMQTMMDNNPELDPSVPATDAMTSAEKTRIDRESELKRQKDIKQKQIELDAKKKEMDFNKKKLDQQRRFDIPNATKDLQRLKGANI